LFTRFRGNESARPPVYTMITPRTLARPTFPPAPKPNEAAPPSPHNPNIPDPLH
jgi:hypothetical protein